MNNWFTVKVKYTKQLDNGALKRVSEPYLLAAMTFSDAETRIYEELEQIIRGEFNVVGIARTEVHEIFVYDDSDVFYKCKVKYDSMDADTEKARKVTQVFLVSAGSVKQAAERIQESLSTLMVDFEVPSIIVSPIVEIFPYSNKLDKELSREPIEKSKAEELAERLNNREYRSETETIDVDFAAENNLLIVYGASDDLMEVDGADEEEYGASVNDQIKFVCLNQDVTINVLSYPWSYSASHKFFKFDINEDGEKWSEGIVIDLN
jgi:hypothetical protein